MGMEAETDVTNQYLVNPSFEVLKAADGEKEVAVKASLTDGLYGWEVVAMSHYCVESYESGSSTGFPAEGENYPPKVQAAAGTYYYFNRQGWADKYSELKTTTSKALPVGRYYAEIYYKAADYSNNNNAARNGTTIGIDVLDADGNKLGATTDVRRSYSLANNDSNPLSDAYIVNAPWTKLGVYFEVTEETKTTISLIQNMKNSGRSDILWDDLKLYALDGETLDVTGLIANPSFEAGNTNGWSVASGASDTGAKLNSNPTYTMEGADGLYVFNTWNGSTHNGGYYVQQALDNLPAGWYELTAALASDENKVITLTAGDASGDYTAIDKEIAEDKTVATKLLPGSSSLLIKASSSSWFKADNFRLTYRPFTEEELAEAAAEAAKVALQNAITAARELMERTANNVGDQPFQYAVSSWDELQDALDKAGEVNESSKKEEEVKAATEALNAAIAAYNMLNVPTEGQLFNIVLTSSESNYKYDNKAVTYLAGRRTDGGNYTIQYQEAANTNLAQAFTFTHVSGNNYKLSQIDADGETRYVSTGVIYGGNTSQIRTTTDAEKALEVTVIPTEKEGVYNLYNTEAKKHIGSQDSGFYTVDRNIDFFLVKTTKPSITINTTVAGWGTVMLPFAVAELPGGVKAYSCAGVDGTTLTLTAVEKLEANKPYIIEGAWNATLTGDAQGTKLTYTDGLLTGVYAETTAPEGSYVLQNQDNVVGFYLVENSDIEVPANRAYLTVNGSGVKGFFFGSDDATAVKGVEAAGEEAGAIYNLAGQRVEKAVKGIYIINGKKVLVK